jgi:Protein of unknown function (DUF4058)
MPSPFPGMDPYLESPDWFPGLHANLIVFMKGALQRSLPESYYADSSQRVWVEYSQRHSEPDVELVQSARRPRKRTRGGGLALFKPGASQPLVVEVETIEHGPFKETFLEIRRRRGKEVRIVTTIEILSPTNKKIGNPGRDKYLEKQREILGSETHLVEIDLLRGGAYALAVPKELITARAGPFEYLVSIHRFNRPTEFLVYPITIRKRLPQIGIPLSPGDTDVPLDLQDVFDRSYDFGPYDREIEYGTDPIVPRLKPEQAEWAAKLLKPRRRES